MEPSVWLIAGPTASGKSALALRLARERAAEILNADSMQIYRGLGRLTAAPTPQELALVPHHLYGVADPLEAWSAGRWLEAAREVLAEARGRRRPLVVVGGTGLYFKALTQGLAPIPATPEPVRAAVAALLAEGGEEALRAALWSADPASVQRVAPGDVFRLRRALEVLRHTGEPIGRWRARGSATLTSGTFAAARLEPDRAVLAERSLLRLRRMAEAGALEEVAALTALGPAPDRPAFKALGFREFAAHLEGRLSLEEALLAAAAATRRYAKRQATWFRHQAPEFTPVPLSGLDDGYEALLGALRLGP